MQNNLPNPNNPFLIKGVDCICYVKPIIKNLNVIVGDLHTLAIVIFSGT